MSSRATDFKTIVSRDGKIDPVGFSRLLEVLAQNQVDMLDLTGQVARLRAECVRATGSPLDQARPENELVRALNRLIAVAESYPELRAADGFLRLQEELANTEDRLQAARRFYNGNVREINNLVQTVPSNLIANLFGFRGEEFFEIEGAAVRHAPVVDMGRQGDPPQSALNLKE